jgi:hypothetical protein
MFVMLIRYFSIIIWLSWLRVDIIILWRFNVIILWYFRIVVLWIRYLSIVVYWCVEIIVLWVWNFGIVVCLRNLGVVILRI